MALGILERLVEYIVQSLGLLVRLLGLKKQQTNKQEIRVAKEVGFILEFRIGISITSTPVYLDWAQSRTAKQFFLRCTHDSVHSLQQRE